MRIITCEQVSDGHPDKICDQISDAIVTDCLKHDKNSRVAVETLIKDEYIVIAGELTSTWNPDYEALISGVFEKIGPRKLDYSNIRLINLVKSQSGDIAIGVDKGGAGDQGMMYGYATDETPEMLPIPYVLATEFLKRLKTVDDSRLKADAKAQVSFDYDTGKITTFLCSVQHTDDCEPKDFENVIIGLMEAVALEREMNIDFEKLVNPTGRFVMGGSFADCGLTGRKIACDTYGGVGRIGGGALSGKDPTKVDRSGAYIARKIAKDIVRLGYCNKCEVQVAYAIGVADPVSVYVDTFGTEHVDRQMIEDYVSKFDLTPRGIIERLDLLNVDYNKVSSYGHFTNFEMSWEVI